MALYDHDGTTVEVHPFSGEYDPLKDVPLATCATIYDCPKTGKPILMLFGQTIFMGDRLTHSLLNPNQIRSNKHIVQDVPVQFDPASSHSVHLDDGELQETIPLVLRGIISAFPTRKPTDHELKTLRPLWVTSDSPWDPSSDQFAQDERLARHAAGTDSPFNRYIDALMTMPLELSGAFMPQPAARTLAALTNGDGSAHGDCTLDHCSCGAGRISEQGRGYDCDCQQIWNSALSTSNIAPRSKAPDIAKRWGISLSAAERTLRASTQKGSTRSGAPGDQRVRSMPWLQKRILPGKWYSDTTFFFVKSIEGDVGAQVVSNGAGYNRFWPLKSKRNASDGLVDLINNVGIPEHMVTDNSKEQGGGGAWKTAWNHVIAKYHIKQTFPEPYSWWQNAAEREIKEIKRGIRRLTRKSKSPRRLWNYLGQVVVAIRARTAHGMPALRGRTPYEIVHGYTPDISMWLMFDWYQLVYYRDNDGEPQLGRWLGYADGYGGGNCHWILPRSCIPIVRSTVWSVPREDFETDDTSERIRAYNQAVIGKIGDGVNLDEELGPEYEDYGDLFEEEADGVDPIEPEAQIPDAEDHTPDTYDNYLQSQVMIPRIDGSVEKGTVVRRVKDDDGTPIGRSNPNPLLDTRQYEVQFEDGTTESLSANLIAESIYAQVDDEGRYHSVLGEILEHRKNAEAIPKEQGFLITKSGQRRPRITTRGWEFLVSWKDGTSDWVRLADLKDTAPVQVAEYARDNQLSEEPAFAWWINHVLRKRDRMINKVKKYWKRTHKYGVRLPKTVQEALEIDRMTGTTFWADALAKEMRNVRVAFEFHPDDVVPVGHQEIRCHIVFDVKITLQRKCRLVANGNELESTKQDTFASVVSRDSVRMFFLLAALNDVDVLSADIQNAYLTAPIKEKLWYRCGPEFGSDEGRPVKVVRALYGLAIAGKTFRNHLAAQLREQLGWIPSKADPDFWFRPATKPDGTKYYEYMLAYVDDLMGSSHKIKGCFDEISAGFKFKEEPEAPKMYLGADIHQWKIDDDDDEPGKVRWALSSTNYTKKAVAEVEEELRQAGLGLSKKATTPLSVGYRPEIDATKELDAQRLNYYQGLIGILRWICELGRLDILVPVSLMSRYIVSAREGHLDQVFLIFAYLKTHERSTMVFDDTEPVFDSRRFECRDWSEFYPGAEGQIPKDAPEPRGKAVTMTCFVDADHAGCKVTRRSHTGVIVFLNRAPILWYSKRQGSVETSTFGSEIMAMKTAIEMVEGLRYKCRMLGVPIEGATNVFCDNDSVVKNTTRPESALKKKANAIAYHKTREAIAAGIIQLAKEDGKTNLSDLLTKLLPGPRLRELAHRILW